ncbi:MAG: hypothetical protein AAF600_11300 [Bacteroidota bacterium]
MNLVKSFFRKGYWIAAVIFSIILWVLISGYYDVDKYREGLITPARIHKSTYASDTRYIDYVYVVKGRKYTERTSVWLEGPREEGEYFYILYLPESPEDHITLFDHKFKSEERLGVDIDFELTDREIYKGVTGW